MGDGLGSLEHPADGIEPVAGGPAGQAAHVLQSLIWPDATLHPDPDMSLRLGVGALLGEDSQSVDFKAGAALTLDTAYNIFPWAKWRAKTGLTRLQLNLRGNGQFALTVSAHEAEVRPLSPLGFAVTLAAGQTQSFDLTDWVADKDDAVLHVTLVATSAGRIEAVDWCTPEAPRRLPKLNLCITTFRREEAARDTAVRFDAFMGQSQLAPYLHLLVVDNARSLTLPPLDHVTLIGNRNVGGSGGFARGLQETIAQGCTHCLFMDDDAAVDMGSITRTWTFLAYAINPAVAIAGALMRADVKHTVWENGAYFLGVCQSRSRDRDLTDPVDVRLMEFESMEPLPVNLYGGFWFFAFAVEAVRHWTFPFFVRGDDISFSIVNQFDIVTLPGVMSFQDMDFPDKETSLTLYLDMRCDMVQNLTLPVMPRRFFRCMRTPVFFFARSLIQSHHDSLHALNLSIEDVLRGPGFFATNVDMAIRRAEIVALRHREVWKPLEGALPVERRWINANSRWQRGVMKLTVNGLLLPFFGLWGNHLVMPQNNRQSVRQCWGAARITYVSTDGTKLMEVRHEKLSTLREGFRMVWNMARLAWNFKAIRKEWVEGYPRYTTAAFWQAAFADDPTLTASTDRHSPRSPAR